MRKFVKYSNRKIYDTQKSGYVNLDQFLSFPSGSFFVVDKTTGKDITKATLMTAVMEHRKNDPVLIKLVEDYLSKSALV